MACVEKCSNSLDRWTFIFSAREYSPSYTYTVYRYTDTIACHLLRNELRKNSISLPIIILFSILVSPLLLFPCILFYSLRSILFRFSLRPFVFSPFLLISRSVSSRLSFLSLFRSVRSFVRTRDFSALHSLSLLHALSTSLLVNLFINFIRSPSLFVIKCLL